MTFSNSNINRARAVLRRHLSFEQAALRRRLIRLIVADITRDVLRRRRLGWRA